MGGCIGGGEGPAYEIMTGVNCSRRSFLEEFLCHGVNFLLTTTQKIKIYNMTPRFLMLFEDADIIDHIMIDLMQGLPREEDFINL